jgi:copper(I)-binding protein
VDPTEPGAVKIVLKGLKKPLRPGQTIRVTFLFEKAGELTLELPIAASPEPREDAPSEH